MSAPNPDNPTHDDAPDPANPIANWRSYRKGPRFGLIVLLACVTLLIIFVIAFFLLHHDAKKMVPHGPTPTPNALVRPAGPFARPLVPQLT